MSNYKPNLSEQQVHFCDEYLVNFNVYRAAIAAGYSENTALKGELLHMPKIQEYLKLKMDQRAERLEISHDMILRELAKIAFSNMGNYYDERGDLRPMCELSERDKAAINQLELIDVVEADGYKVGKITKIKLHNKMSALDKIARHLGFYEKNQDARGRNQENKLEEPGVLSVESGALSSEQGDLIVGREIEKCGLIEASGEENIEKIENELMTAGPDDENEVVWIDGAATIEKKSYNIPPPDEAGYGKRDASVKTLKSYMPEPIEEQAVTACFG